MAIKSKISPDQYGEDARSPIDLSQLKPLAYNAIKLLKTKGEDAKTSFFVKKNYFKDTKGKVNGHFLAIGDSAKLIKKFKKEKTSSDVAYGNLFIKKEEGKDDVICFEYIAGQGMLKKVGDWNILFKSFKRMLKADCLLIVDEVEGDNQKDIADTNEEDRETADLNSIKKKIQPLLRQLKTLEPKNAFKGLALIHGINDLIDKLEEVPENLQVLSKKLEVQQQKKIPILATQISKKWEQSVAELKGTALIKSSDELDRVFGTTQKMYAGWKKMLVGQEHPSAFAIEAMNAKINTLKDYESQIMPLRKQYDGMEASQEKEKLGGRINELIHEARAALA